jgi:ferredoxin
MTKISINQNECLGCGLCTSYIPEVFEVDEKDFKAKLKTNGSLSDNVSIELNAEQLKKVQESVEGCPVKAIKISE